MYVLAPTLVLECGYLAYCIASLGCDYLCHYMCIHSLCLHSKCLQHIWAAEPVDSLMSRSIGIVVTPLPLSLINEMTSG